MNAVHLDHPSRESLADYGLGKLDEASASAVHDHLEYCDACRRFVESAADDTLALMVRASATPPDPTFALPVPVPSSTPTVPPALVDHPRYRVVELLGSGGMGAVYRAEHRLMERVVALKVINRELTSRPGVLERFRREAKAAALLDHPNIVRAHDADQVADTHFLVMECVAGTDLARLVRERGPLPVAEACEYARQAALGLQHAFEHGMVHRDIKPQNLIVTLAGQIKILDFGLARLASEVAAPAASVAPEVTAAGIDPASSVTAAGVVLGTADYIAPEQAEDPHKADIRADIYSLGCTLYFLLTGQPPFPEGTLMQKILAHGKNTLRPLSDFRKDVPAGLLAVLHRMTAKEPGQRCATPIEAARALAPFARPSDEAGKPPRPRRRWPLAAAVLLLLGLGLVAAVAVYRIQTDYGELVIRTDNPDVEVIIKGNGNDVRIVDTKTNREVRLKSGQYDLELKGNPEELKLSLDRVTIRRGETVVATVERQTKPMAETVGEVRSFRGHTDAVWGVAFSPNGRQALSTSSDFSIRLWDLDSGKAIRSYQGHTNHTHAVAFSPDGREFLSCSQDGTMRRWNVATGEELNRADLGNELLTDVALSPDGKLALVASFDKTLHLWDVKAWKEIRQFEGHTNHVQRVVFSADGRRALSAGWDRTVRLWDVESGKEIRCFEGHQDSVVGLALSPDGRLALSGAGGEKPLRLWDVETGKELRAFEGHEGGVHGVAFSPDGRLALSGGADNTIRLWEVATGKELHCFHGHRATVYSVAFSLDFRYALSGSHDRTMRLWRLPTIQPQKK